MLIVFVEEDAAVSTNAVINLAIKYGFDKTTSKVCGMDAAMGHPFLSPYDDIDVDKYWISEVTQKIADDLTRGQPMSQDGLSTSGWPGCEINSTPRSNLEDYPSAANSVASEHGAHLVTLPVQ